MIAKLSLNEYEIPCYSIEQAIPREFITEIGEKLSGVVRLSVSNGNFWDVELRKVGGRTWLEGGLQEFLEYHFVSPGYFLVFNYEGNSKFHVFIFDMSCCEIEYSCHVNKLDEPKEERSKKHLEEECGEEESTDISSAESEEEESTDISSAESEEEESMDIMEIPRTTSRKNFKQSRVPRKLRTAEESETAASKKKFNPRKKHIEEECKEDESKDIPGSASRKKFNPFGVLLRLSLAEKDRVTALAKSYKSENPWFMVIIRKSYISGKFMVNIPGGFLEIHMKNSVSVILCVSRRKWEVHCTNDHLKLTSGWKKFALDNELKEDDICFFELVKPNHEELKVTIFRLSEM
ncbi:hypothetical protein GIB67_019523 [Kingdonia uniflora]|uniref:TF-B3 domain-containing protein n=1 Tax=Kingdonia uniflora TaxID=39325 RepID=A0A7J7N0C1_9MAGN|nr:hypothetical protein GIB67_019523 [Kingdonia uniflora]